MTLHRLAVALALILALSLLCACAPAGLQGTLPEETAETLTETTAAATKPTEASTAPTEETIEETLSPDERDYLCKQFVLERTRRPVEETYAYPFNDEEMEEAYAMVLAEVMDMEWCTDLEIHRVTYDPYMTDSTIRTYYYTALDNELPFKELYGRFLVITATYSCVFTNDSPFDRGPVENRITRFILKRSSLDSSWEKIDSGIFRQDSVGSSGFLAQEYALTPEELSQFTFPMGPVLGGYLMEDGNYWLYVWDEEAQSSRLVKLEVGEPSDLSLL